MIDKRRNINTGSHSGPMADMAFLLLIFFMVCTNIVNDKGLTLLLPPHKAEENIVPVKDRNLFTILINSSDRLFVENEERSNAENLRTEIKDFVLNAGKRPDWSVNPKKAVISIQTNRGTSQGAFIKILDEAKAAYYEIYADKAGITPAAYRKLASSDPIYKKARHEIPMNISIASSKVAD
ncbi:biopolymer transporter ExbD [Fulvivirga sp. M361]|uniref:ExbD/TolR family protein n=1 Tax=Fulvivirga sp. M361 TaxID=2594266 RepID=UPI00117AE8E8|nr:biopolymer transporter ExbD [Fulvivirga sp. M361]TRX56059.1 biopolymer transporter ExbD [Fulvivirga sp. M361]